MRRRMVDSWRAAYKAALPHIHSLRVSQAGGGGGGGEGEGPIRLPVAEAMAVLGDGKGGWGVQGREGGWGVQGREGG